MSPFNTNPDFIKRKRKQSAKYIAIPSGSAATSSNMLASPIPKRPKKREKLFMYNSIDEADHSLPSVSPNTSPAKNPKKLIPLHPHDKELSKMLPDEKAAMVVENKNDEPQKEERKETKLDAAGGKAPSKSTNVTTQAFSIKPSQQAQKLFASGNLESKFRETIKEMKEELDRVSTQVKGFFCLPLFIFRGCH